MAATRTKPGRKVDGKKRKRRKNGADGPLIGFLGRFRRRAGHWIGVAAILSTVIGGGVVGFFALNMPDTVDWTVPAKTANVRILASNGELISNRGDSSGASLTLAEMPPFLPEAVIAIEDRRFYSHFGIDPIGLARATVANFRAGGVVEGGSTLTQQLAKNLFLTANRTFERKVQEVILAVWLEMRLSKKQILELYLNRVYLGGGAYGVDAAAHRYFGKSARDITLAEAATLAGMLKAPAHYSPATNPQAAEARTQLVLGAMHANGFITDRQASLAMSSEVKAVRDIAGGSGRYVADWVMDTLWCYVGAVGEDVVVDTTVDLRLQAAAARAVAGTLDEQVAIYVFGQAALFAVDPTGAVKALVGGRDYAASPFNRAVDGHRQPGSAFKPFVYLAAVERGLTPESVRIDQPIAIRGWRPENYTRSYKGPVTLQTALSLSLNTVSVQLVSEVGPAAVASVAHRLGIASPLMATPSIALGTSEVTPLEMTAAFVPFSNGGRGVIPYAIKRITTARGKVLYQRSGSGPGQVIDPAYVAMMNTMMTATLTSGTGRAAQLPGWPAAGKTGTSQDFRDAWFIGYTSALTAGVWFGNDDGKPTKKASGSNLPAQTWQRFMVEALDGVTIAELPGNYRTGDRANYASTRQPIPPELFATEGEAGEPLVITPRAARPAPPRSQDVTGSIAAAPAGIPDEMWTDEPDMLLPPANFGAPKRRGILEELFGG
ncbi:transglycosylase domain-containing protein [soil metagenome]